MNVTVLGATGFIGSWAARALVAEGHDVHALVRPSSDLWRIESVRGVSVEAADASSWPEALAVAAPEVLLSLDWEGVSASDRDDEGVQQHNLQRQATLYEAALGAGTRRIVGTGSQAEYGPIDGVIEEDAAVWPETAYGRAKVAASAALAMATARAEHVWARVFSVFGPLETGAWLLPTIARGAATGESTTLSSGTQPWSYLFAADAGRALAVLATHPDATGTYNLAHPEAPPLRESAEAFAAELGVTVEFGATAGAGLQARVTRLLDLGWEPQWPRDRAFATTAAWFRGDVVPDPLIAGSTLPGAR